MRLRGIGVDIVDVARVARLLDRGPGFARRWFTPQERERCRHSEHPEREYARLLAAKEAAWKALGLDGSGRVPWAWMAVADGRADLSGWVRAAAGDVGPIEVTTEADERLAQAWALAWERVEALSRP